MNRVFKAFSMHCFLLIYILFIWSGFNSLYAQSKFMRDSESRQCLDMSPRPLSPLCPRSVFHDFGRSVDLLEISVQTYNYVSYVYTFKELYIFSYFNDTEIVIKNELSTIIWQGILPEDSYQFLDLGEGIYQISGSKKYAVLIGDPVYDSTVGYFAMDENSKPLSKKLLTFNPNANIATWGERGYFIIWSYQDSSNITLYDLDTEDIIWSGALNEGEYKSFQTETSERFLKITSDKPVSAQSYVDQGYFVPASNNSFIGEIFYVYSGGLIWGGSNYGEDFQIIAYHDNTNIELIDLNGGLLRQVVLNKGEIHHELDIYKKYLKIVSDKGISVCSITNTMGESAQLLVAPDFTGHGIGENFYVPCIKGNLDILVYQDDTEITATKMSSSTNVLSITLDAFQHHRISTSFDLYKVEGSKPISVVESSRTRAGAEFVPLYYSLFPNFRIDVRPDELEIIQGFSDSCLVSLIPIDQFGGTAELSISPAITEISTEFTPIEIDSNTVSVLKIQTTIGVSPGVYEFIISGTSGGLNSSDTLSLTILDAPYVPIYPSVDTLHIAGEEFWVDIYIGESTNEVSNLYGTSFALSFDSDWLTPVDSTGVAGRFIGSPVEVLPPIVSGDTLFTEVTRTDTNRVGVSGSGSVLRIKFKIREDTPDTTLCFYILNPVAFDPDWNLIFLAPKSDCIQIIPSLSVWPGDTDNNGIVNQADLLPIGVCWNEMGYPRTGYTNLVNWESQDCRPWPQGEHYTYADANGDSVIDQNDVLVLGLNWHKKRGLSKSYSEPLVLSSTGTFKPVILEDSGYIMEIGCEVEGVENLLGVGFEMDYVSSGIEVVSVMKGDFLGEEALLFHHNEPDEEKLGIAVTRYRGQGGISGKGCVIRIRMRLKANANLSAIDFNRVTGMDVQGNQFEFEKESLDLISSLSENKNNPESFILHQNYPNPFNSSTRMKYELPERTYVSIKVYDLLGSEVMTLISGEKEAGFYEVIWNGRDHWDEHVSSGIYYFKIETSGFKCVRKGLLLK